MADPCTSCTCVPYENICCCPPQAGISVMQPKCQVLVTACNESTFVNNPCYCDGTPGKSTWTYKFFTDCADETRAISYFLIPICVDIQPSQVTVEERIDGCSDFRTLIYGEDEEYVLTTQDGDPDVGFGPSPEDYQWLKILNNPMRYKKGVCVQYRITIAGNYPTVNQSIRVKSGDSKLFFCDENPENSCFLIPGCPPPGALGITTTCDSSVSDGTAVFNYTVTVENTGGKPVSDVQLNEVITYDENNFAFRSISVAPPLVAAPDGGQVTILGNIGTLDPSPGVPFAATYILTLVPTASAVPGAYTVNNTATAASGNITASSDITASDNSSYNTEIVQLSRSKCCEITNGNHITFRITISTVGDSPATTINYVDNAEIPDGVTVKFTNFDGCTAALNGSPITAPVSVAGPNIVTISCDDLPVSDHGGSITKLVELDVVSTSIFSCESSPLIANTLISGNGTNTNHQIYITSTDPAPTVKVRVVGCVTSTDLCSST